jgi:hypothetical protein
MTDAYAVLEAEFDNCFICGALVRRGNYAMLHEDWHRRHEGDPGSPP